MIITLTLNPALDNTVQVEKLVPGELNRILSTKIDAGGKGINASKMISELGGSCIATGFLGGTSGFQLRSILDNLNLNHDFIEVAANTRTNTKVLDSTHGITELNEPGILVTAQEEEKLISKLLSYEDGSIYVLAGSLHGGAHPEFYKKLILALKTKGLVFFDADGASFSHGLEAVPYFVKPNRQEMLSHFGKQSANFDELLEMCRTIMSKGVGCVVMSMGSDGAIFVTKNVGYHAKGLKVTPSSTVGAGDSLVGTMVYAKSVGLDLEESARLAVGASAGAVTTQGTNPPSLELVHKLRDRVELIRLY